MVFGLFGGGDVQIGVDVDERAGGFGPGDTLEARITLDAGKGLKAREVRAGLVIVERYETTDEYRDNDGDGRTRDVWKSDETWVRREVLARDDVPAGQRSYSFAWPIPTNAPPPCAGKIVQVKYLVKVTVDKKLAKDINVERVINIVSHAPGRNDTPVELGSSSDNEARMWFTLPRLEFLEGETIRGMLH